MRFRSCSSLSQLPIGALSSDEIRGMKYGIIAGNGRFPVIALEAARRQGDEAVAIAIREEAWGEVERAAERCYWISLGELSRLIEICKTEGIRQIMMAGQVKHAKIFSSIRADWRLFKLLASLGAKNTESLIGGVARVLADEGIELVDSTLLLKPLLATAGVMSRRKPGAEENRDIEWGRHIAHGLAALDVGQSVAVCDRACVAVEAMEGTDSMLRRAAALAEGRQLRLIKASSRRRHLLFDVPVIGPGTADVMAETGTTALAIDAGRTLVLDREEFLAKANNAGLAVVGLEPQG